VEGIEADEGEPTFGVLDVPLPMRFGQDVEELVVVHASNSQLLN
jgi:hypothetical protein